MEYYVFSSQAEADSCVNAINNSGWFPITGTVKGISAPNNQKTTQWVESPRETASGEWAVPRIPNSRLDFIGVPQVDRDSFLTAYGQDIKSLENSDFTVQE